MIHNPELWAKMRALADGVVPRLFDVASTGDQVDHAVRKRFVRDTLNQWGTVFRAEPIWLGLVRRHEDWIVRLPEYSAIYDSLKTDVAARAFVRRTYTSVSDADLDSSSDLFYVPIVEEYLVQATALSVESGQRTPPTALLDDLYESLEAELYDEETTYRILAPLCRFQLDVPQIDLSLGRVIRAVNDSDRDLWVGALDLTSPDSTGPNFPYADFAIVVENYCKPSGWATVRPSAEVVNVLTALRLFKPVRVAVPAFMYGKPHNWRTLRWVVEPLGIVRAQMSGPLMHINADEAANFQSYWSRYSKCVEARNEVVGIALARFNRSMADISAEDRIIDCCVAFDSLVGLETFELTYRVQQRLAFLLGNGPEQRIQIAELVRLIYETRGQIIHGKRVDEDRLKKRSEARLKNKIATMEQLSDHGVGLLARAIVAFLSLPLKVTVGDAELPLDGNRGKILDHNILTGGDTLRRFVSAAGSYTDIDQ